MYKLFIDDARMAPDGSWFVVRSYGQAIRFITNQGCPDFISFDHDLGEDKSGLDVAKWLVDVDLRFRGEFIPDHFKFKVHSANIIGGENIELFLSQYLKLRKTENEE